MNLGSDQGATERAISPKMGPRPTIMKQRGARDSAKAPGRPFRASRLLVRSRIQFPVSAL